MIALRRGNFRVSSNVQTCMSPRPTIRADRGARSTGRRRLAVAAAVTILGALAVACSSSADPQSSVPSDTAGPTLATTSETTPQDSTGTDSTGTDSTGTDSTGTDSTVTGSTAPDSTVPET